METDKIRVSSTGEGFSAALEETDRFAAYEGLDKKDALRLRLLAEETLGMVRAITEDFEADFWLEENADKVCRMHLVADTKMDYLKKRELIDVSTDKKNASARGFMGKIRELIENGLYSTDEMGQLSAEYGDTNIIYGTLGMCDVETAAMTPYVYQWSLSQYRAGLDEEQAAEEVWDELEKSIVASIADEVRVGVRGDQVELIIEKCWTR